MCTYSSGSYAPPLVMHRVPPLEGRAPLFEKRWVMVSSPQNQSVSLEFIIQKSHIVENLKSGFSNCSSFYRICYDAVEAWNDNRMAAMLSTF